MPPAVPIPTPDENMRAILDSPTYRLAARDVDFLARPELRPVRMQLELLKPEMTMLEHKVLSTIVVFGGSRFVEREVAAARLVLAEEALAAADDDAHARRAVERARRIVEKSRYYEDAREFARLASVYGQRTEVCDYVITTGGGPGIMEAANRGAFEIGALTIGLNITLPAEQKPNAYISPQLCFDFHYFALRKMHFLLRARALVIFPGGFGTLDELFETLTLRQTNRMQPIPVIIYGREYWDRVINFRALADEGAIDDEHLGLLSYADTPAEAMEIVRRCEEEGVCSTEPAGR
ncbi:MAG: LOG family protein [Pirellulales bacterium]